MTYGWTLDNDSWKRLSSAIGKRDWRKVPFSILEKGDVPTCYGVYVFCAKPCPGEKRPLRHLLTNLFNAVYVGQALNLRQRFQDHVRDPMDPMIAVRQCFGYSLEFWFIRLETLEELCEIESILIECLGPAANRQRGPALRGKLGAARPA